MTGTKGRRALEGGFNRMRYIEAGRGGRGGGVGQPVSPIAQRSKEKDKQGMSLYDAQYLTLNNQMKQTNEGNKAFLLVTVKLKIIKR